MSLISINSMNFLKLKYLNFEFSVYYNRKHSLVAHLTNFIFKITQLSIKIAYKQIEFGIIVHYEFW